MLSKLNKLFNRFSINYILPQFSPKFRYFSSIVKGEGERTEINNLYQNERTFDELSIDTFKEIITDKTIADKISLILSEYEYEKYTTLVVPTTITTDQMKDLLKCIDSKDRKSWFHYLFRKQSSQNRVKVDRKKHSEEYWKQKQQIYSQINSGRTGIWDNNHQLVYGLWHNSLFSKIRDNTLTRYYSHRLRRAALFGPKLVIDLDYDQYMSVNECRQVSRQISSVYNWNRKRSEQPFDLHFTNCKPNMPTLQAIKKLLVNHNSPHFLVDFHQKSYTHLFSKERLVYLSQQSEHSLNKFDSEVIYILGAFKSNPSSELISYVKAKKEGIRCVRLPIDEHILWKSGNGTNDLNLSIRMTILHDTHLTDNIGKAIRERIPQEMQKSVEQLEYEDMIRKQKFQKSKFRKKF